MIKEDCEIHSSVKVTEPVTLYGCVLKKDVFVGPFVEIQKDVFVDEGTRVQSHTFICSEVKIGKNCFIGHGVMFINDSFSDSTVNFSGPYEKTIIEDAIDSDCPLSSASFPGKAPAVSTKVITGKLNFSAIEISL